jgi:hypothetical protein
VRQITIVFAICTRKSHALPGALLLAIVTARVGTCPIATAWNNTPHACEDLRAMHEPIDEGSNIGSVREDLVPFAEVIVGRRGHETLQLIAASDHLEEQIDIACAIGQVPDLDDPKYCGVRAV